MHVLTYVCIDLPPSSFLLVVLFQAVGADDRNGKSGESQGRITLGALLSFVKMLTTQDPEFVEAILDSLDLLE